MCSIEIANQTIHQKTCLLHAWKCTTTTSTEKNMRLQPTAMFGIFIGTTRCHRTGSAGWPCPHISNCYHGELSPYLLNVPVVTLSLAVLLIFIEPGQGNFSPDIHRPVFALTLAVSQ